MDLYNSLKHFKKTCSLQYFGGGGEKTKPFSMVCLASLVSQMIKNLPAVQGTWVNPWIGKIPWRREWQPTSVFLPEKSLGQRSLAGYSPHVHKESDTTEEQNAPTHSVQSLSPVWFFAIPWTVAHQASLSITTSWSLLKLLSIMLVMPSSHLILCRPFLPPSVFPSIRVFINEAVLHIKWPEYWSFSFSISPSTEYSGPSSFRMDWLDLLTVQGTLKSLL